jgi:hypothetical protein
MEEDGPALSAGDKFLQPRPCGLRHAAALYFGRHGWKFVITMDMVFGCLAWWGLPFDYSPLPKTTAANDVLIGFLVMAIPGGLLFLGNLLMAISGFCWLAYRFGKDADIPSVALVGAGEPLNQELLEAEGAAGSAK